MIAAFFFLVLLAYVIIKTINYLYLCTKILANGKKVIGKVVSYKTYRYNIFLKNALIPVLMFLSDKNEKVTTIPIHSLLVELFPYKLNSDQRVIYDCENPLRCIIYNKVELVTSLIVTFLGVVYVVWFYFKYIELKW